MNTFLEVDNISLEVPIYDVSRSFRKSAFLYFTGGNIIQSQNKPRAVSVRALENIKFRLKKGDRLGLIGHNGAGKTTLLRVLAGVYKPLTGNVNFFGKITPLFNPSLGMDGDDTGLENISTMGLYLGMSQEEIENKKDDIISFSDLGDFIHLPVRTYSAGMQLRLSFAVSTALEPEILLMDEGISAGDAQFAEKAKIRLDEFYQNLDILVIASHSGDLIRKLCNKALLLQHGNMVAFGEVDEVLETYYKSIQ